MKIHKTFCREELEKLPSDQLDRMLHEELSKESKDAELILALMRILEEREADMPVPDVGKAWEKFVGRYNTEIAPEPTERRKSPYRWLGAVAAAVVVFFVVSFGIPKAAGHDNIFKLIASWTDDFFTLSDPDDEPVQSEYVFKTDNPGLQQVYDAVVKIGITDPVVPMWIPEGYELVELKTSTVAGSVKVLAIFEKADASITLYYKLSQNPEWSDFPKDEYDVEVVELGGVSVSILSNLENTTAIWNSSNTVCYLSATEDKGVITSILRSVFYGGQ